MTLEVRLELRYVERYKERKQYECLEEIHKEEIIDHLAKLVVSDEKDEAAISFDVLMLFNSSKGLTESLPFLFKYLRLMYESRRQCVNIDISELDLIWK